MSQTIKYAEVFAKIGSERSKIMDSTKLNALIEAHDLTDFVFQLRETPYQKEITKVFTPLNSRKLEHAFKRNLIETYAKIVKYSPQISQNYLATYLKRIELENVKNIAKAVSSRMPGEDRQMRIYLSVEDFFKRRGLFKEAIQIDEMKSLIALFKKTEYEFTLSQGLKRYQESGSTFSLEILLDKAFFDTRLRLFNELPNKEKKHAIFYESIEHDGFVLSTLLRGKALNYDEQLLRESLPESTLRISRGQVQELLKTQDYTSALKVVGKTEYGKYFAKDETPEKTIANAEKAFKIALLNHAKKSRIVHEFHIGIPLSFITLKEAEVNALTAIGVGIEVAMKPENIRQALVLPI